MVRGGTRRLGRSSCGGRLVGHRPRTPAGTASRRTATVVQDWTDAMSSAGGGTSDVHDVFSDDVRYRVFLLRSSLQVDLSFWPYETFRGSGEPFQLLFGDPAEPTEPRPVDTDRAIGMGWLFAVHARSAIARGRVWQAAGMLDELRSILITLQCARVGLRVLARPRSGQSA